MSVPRITRCADGHFRRVIYSLGPYIGDYPEQALLACVVQGWCPKCTALPDDLDAPSGRRSHAHTETLLGSLNLQELWDNYGIVGDLIVSQHLFSPRIELMNAFFHSLSPPDFLEPTFMNSCHRTYCTKSSKGPSRTILLTGSSTTLTTLIRRHTPLEFWLILTDG